MSSVPRRIVLEVSVTDVDGARLAESAGADRLELCSGLEIGGLTPSPGCFLDVRNEVDLPVYVLLRPRSGGFTYSDAQFATMQRDAEWFLKHGASGIVFGIVQHQAWLNQPDRERCRTLVELAGGKAVFHRAFDFVAEPLAAMEELTEIGFERIQTSGSCPSALEGAAQIAQLITHPVRKIEILPAGGIRPDNVAKLIAMTGADQVHASLRAPTADPSLAANRGIAKGMGSFDPNLECLTTSSELIRAMRIELDR